MVLRVRDCCLDVISFQIVPDPEIRSSGPAQEDPRCLGAFDSWSG